jgi:PAS domain S-box-containing protein
MLESDLFALLEHTGDAAYSVTADGEIRSWNGAARQLFGHAATEVIGRRVDEVLDARDVLGTDALGGGLDAATRRWETGAEGVTNFDLDVRTKSGDRIWVNVSTLVFDSTRAGGRLFVRLARDVTHRRKQEELLRRAADIGRELASLGAEASQHAPVDLLSERERRILTLFAQGKNAGTIARQLRISSHTLRNHLHHINRKLRTHNRLEAVIHALRRGLIE